MEFCVKSVYSIKKKTTSVLLSRQAANACFTEENKVNSITERLCVIGYKVYKSVCVLVILIR